MRWGDAVREAGFEPNQFDNSYDKDYLIEKYAKLAPSLDEFPCLATSE